MITPKFFLNFTTAVLDPSITFTRSGATATRINSSGLIEAVAADTPRFDFDPVSLVCRGLLIEDTRVNSLPNSEEINLWSQSGTVNVNQNVITAPDGNQTADEIVGTTTPTNRRFQTLSFTSGITYTYSIFSKETSGSQPGFRILNAANSIVMRLDVLFTSGVPSFTSTTGATNPRIENFGNGWYRISGSYTAAGTENHNITIYPDRSGTQKTAYVWGGQLETESGATSYIPTTTTAVTRNADVATITGADFSGFWQAGNGGLLVRAQPGTVSGTRPWVQVDDNTADEIIALRGNGADPELVIVAGGTPQATLDAGTIAANTVYNLNTSWNSNDCRARLESGAMVSALLPTIPTVTQMRIGSNGTNYLNGHLETIDYFDEIYMPGTSFLPTVFI